jgi:hypothetical protein
MPWRQGEVPTRLAGPVAHGDGLIAVLGPHAADETCALRLRRLSPTHPPAVRALTGQGPATGCRLLAWPRFSEPAPRGVAFTMQTVPRSQHLRTVAVRGGPFSLAKSRLKLVAPTEVNRTVAPTRCPNTELPCPGRLRQPFGRPPGWSDSMRPPGRFAGRPGHTIMLMAPSTPAA